MAQPAVAPTASPTIVDRVSLRRKGPSRFVGRPVRTLRGSMFGGQLVGQTWAAAAATVDRHRCPISLQLYFIAAPDPDRDVVYDVERRRDGGRFAWRHVLARQGETVVVEALVAFGTSPATMQVPTQPLGVPLPSERDRSAGDEAIARRVEHYFGHVTMGALDVRYVEGSPPRRLAEGDREPRHQFWARPLGVAEWTAERVSGALALLSDVNMLAMPLLEVGELGDGTDTYAVSFDHNMRFYTPLDRLDWLLFRQESVLVAPEGMVEARGTVLAPDGRVVFTANQQGVVFRSRAD